MLTSLVGNLNNRKRTSSSGFHIHLFRSVNVWSRWMDRISQSSSKRSLNSQNNPCTKLHLVNGLIFTGGWSKTGQYLKTVKLVFKDNGILENFNAISPPSTLQFSENANLEGTVFQRFPSDLLKKTKTDCLVLHNHRYGISPAKLKQNAKLSSFFEILTTTKDKDDKVFVSTARGQNYPVTVFQWHPEKNAFEWASSGKQPHTEDAIRVTQSAANFLASEARKSSNRPNAQEVRDNLIYNYIPTYGGKAGIGDMVGFMVVVSVSCGGGVLDGGYCDR
ncbi:hypothetical protein RIF29_38961 [Crotalaria pallida]|uniref:folate gamma-glutamyl hydrolase n=1 Tax=Crotalaria pallida TaxID=3830 RepID=A0AAN9HSV5_CROPI